MVRGRGKLGDGYAGDSGIFWMHRWELLVRRGFDHFTDADDVARFVGSEVNTQRRGISNDVEHSSVGDIHFYGAESGDFDRRIEMNGECRNILKCDAP